MAMPEYMADFFKESVFSLKLWQSLFFVKLQSFTMTESDFSKASTFSYKHESFA